MNYKNIIRFLDDIEKEKPHFYNLLFNNNNNSSDIRIYEMTRQCGHLFKKYNMEEYCFDTFSGYNIHLCKRGEYYIEFRITSKNNIYPYLKTINIDVIFIEDLIQYKHIFDFSIIEMTEEELFYIELKELFGNKKG